MKMKPFGRSQVRGSEDRESTYKMRIRDPEDHEQRLAGWVSSRNDELIGAPFVGQNSLSTKMGQNGDHMVTLEMIY
jgi:hypothetical protein